MTEKSTVPLPPTVIEAVRLYFVINKPTYNAVDEHVGISAVLRKTTSTVIQRSANYMGLNEWSLEIFVPPFSTLDYNACLYLPSRSKVSDFGDTRGLFLPPPVANFKNHPWLKPSNVEAPNVQTHQRLDNIIHKEDCELRHLVVANKSLRIDLVYGRNEVKVTEMRSHLTPTGDPLGIRVQLPEDTGFYTPDIRHFIDKEYQDNTIADSKLISVEIGAAHDRIYHTIKDPAVVLDHDKHMFEEVTPVTPLIESGKNISEEADTSPSSGYNYPSSSTIWNIAKYGIPILGLGLAATLYYKYK